MERSRMYHLVIAWDGTASTMYAEGDPCAACGGECLKAEQHAKATKDAIQGFMVTGDFPTQEEADDVMALLADAMARWTAVTRPKDGGTVAGVAVGNSGKDGEGS